MIPSRVKFLKGCAIGRGSYTVMLSLVQIEQVKKTAQTGVISGCSSLCTRMANQERLWGFFT
jgi:hypothetical protein